MVSQAMVGYENLVDTVFKTADRGTYSAVWSRQVVLLSHAKFGGRHLLDICSWCQNDDNHTAKSRIFDNHTAKSRILSSRASLSLLL